VTQPFDTNKRVEQYIQLRDLIKAKDDAHKLAMAPYRETLEQLNSALLAHLNQIGGDSVRTENGTVYKTEKKSATLADKSAFWAHVVVNGEWELLDWKANPAAVAEFVEKHNTLPPGVNFNVTHVVGVRRS
jgi:hypothetical protein